METAMEMAGRDGTGIMEVGRRWNECNRGGGPPARKAGGTAKTEPIVGTGGSGRIGDRTPIVRMTTRGRVGEMDPLKHRQRDRGGICPSRTATLYVRRVKCRRKPLVNPNGKRVLKTGDEGRYAPQGVD